MARKKNKPCGFVSGMTLDFAWSLEEVYIAQKMILNGATIKHLAKEFNRDILEVMILVDDLLKMDRIQPSRSLLKEVI